jgi:2-dehydro-3-deoxyphosphooctonate aldolase (KDO 8-P synthase)
MITINDLNKSENFFLMAGPCVIEGEDMALRIAEKIVGITERLHIPYVFKGSYRKANRSRLDSFTGIGDEKALKILRKVGETFNIPTVTDIHETTEAAMAAEYVDVLQIPAFLCRQTDLLVAAAETGKIVNIKKGQFLSPGAMQFAVQKVVDAGNDNVMITERGTTFGYTDLVVDFRGIPQMQTFGFPVIMDVTHSLQQPNQTSGVTGGLPALIETSESRYSRRHGRPVYRDPPGTKPSQIRRGQYAQTGFIGRSFDTFGTSTPSDPIKNKGPLLKRPLYFLFLRSII